MASPPSRKRFKVEEVLRRLDLSDEEGFEEYDSDRLSENELDDVEPESDMDSDATEDYDPQIPHDADADVRPTAADAGSRDPDSAGDGHVERDNSGSIPAFTPRIWESIPCNYTPNVEFDYRYTSGLNSSINLNAEQQLSGCRGLRRVSGCRRLPGVAASW